MFSAGSPDKIAALGHAQAGCKHQGHARKALRELREPSQTRFVSAYDFAIVCVGLGETEQAFEWLQKACEERSFSMLMSLKSEPRLDPLRPILAFETSCAGWDCHSSRVDYLNTRTSLEPARRISLIVMVPPAVAL